MKPHTQLHSTDICTAITNIYPTHVFPYVSALQSRNYGSQSSKTSSSSTSRGSGYYSYNSSQEEVTPVKKPKTNSYKGPLEEGTLELRPPFEQVKVRRNYVVHTLYVSPYLVLYCRACRD